MHEDGQGGARFDEAPQVAYRGGGCVRHRDVVSTVAAADAEDHRGGRSLSLLFFF